MNIGDLGLIFFILCERRLSIKGVSQDTHPKSDENKLYLTHFGFFFTLAYHSVIHFSAFVLKYETRSSMNYHKVNMKPTTISGYITLSVNQNNIFMFLPGHFPLLYLPKKLLS